MSDSAQLKQLLRIKAKMIWRVFRDMPIFALILFMGFLFALFFVIYRSSTITPYNRYVLYGVSILLLSVQQSRKDYHFCRKILRRPYLLFVLEYLLISIPFGITTAWRQQYLLSAAYVALPFVVATVPQAKPRRFSKSAPLLLEMPSLETASFFRKYRVAIGLILLCATVLCFTAGFSVLLVYLLLLFYAMTSFKQSESLTLLCLEERPARQFLSRKIRRELVFWAKLMLPILLAYIPFNLDTAHFVLVPILLLPLCIVTCVSMKYADYSPKKNLDGSVFQIICLMGYVIPMLLPISLVMAIVYYRAALNNLKQYLDAFYR